MSSKIVYSDSKDARPLSTKTKNIRVNENVVRIGDEINYIQITKEGILTLVGSASLTGNIAGNVTGDVLGDVIGDLTGSVTLPAADVLVASEDMGDTDFASNSVTLNGTAACAISNWTPTVGNTYTFHCVTSVANSPTVTLSSGITWDGTNDVATFDAVDEWIQVICISATKLKVVANPDSISFS